MTLVIDNGVRDNRVAFCVKQCRSKLDKSATRLASECVFVRLYTMSLTKSIALLRPCDPVRPTGNR
jgi:hypothetical protein